MPPLSVGEPVRRALRPPLLVALLLAACAPPGEAPPAARGGSSGGGSALGEADPTRGELLGLTCRACHTLRAGEDHLIGPNLHGLFGRRVASAPGFGYSDALRAADFVWTPERLDAWLADPTGFLPGNNMPFAGFSAAADRRALVAYLSQATADRAP